MTAQIPQGQDITINLALKGVDGLPLNIGSCENVKIFLYQKKETILYDGSILGGQITIVDAPDGLVQVNITGSNIATQYGRLFAEVHALVDDTSFAIGYKTNIFTDIILGDIINSVE